MASRSPKKAAPNKAGAKRGARAPKVPAARAKHLPAVVSEGYADLVARSASVRDFSGDRDIADKHSLIGRSFVIVGWTWRDSSYDDREDGGYVSVELVTDDGEPLVFNDGGTGIKPTLEKAEGSLAVSVEGMKVIPAIPIYCPRGLKVSSYDGPKGPAETFYFA